MFKVNKNVVINVLKVAAGAALAFVGIKGMIPEKKEEALPEAPATPETTEEVTPEPVDAEVVE